MHSDQDLRKMAISSAWDQLEKIIFASRCFQEPDILV